MRYRPLGRTGLTVSALGFGAFKVGRSRGAKYPGRYDLPTDTEAERLLNGVLDLGITFVDTAPAYGLSEERIGRFLSCRRGEFVLATKAGEEFEQGESRHDFSAAAVRRSLERSLRRLRTEVLDVVLVHSDGNELRVQRESDVVPVLAELKASGAVRAIGFSGKTVVGAREALGWADVLMVEFHVGDTSHAEVMAEAARQGVGVVVKKGLASGRLPAETAIPFVLSSPLVTSLVVGGSDLEHVRANVVIAEGALPVRGAG